MNFIDAAQLRALGEAMRAGGLRHAQIKLADGSVLILEAEMAPPFEGELVEPATDPGGWKRGATSLADE